MRCFGGQGVVVDVPGVCPCLLWRRLGGLLVYRLWWRWLLLVPEVAGRDADGGVVLAMVLLMPLAWVVYRVGTIQYV